MSETALEILHRNTNNMERILKGQSPECSCSSMNTMPNGCKDFTIEGVSGTTRCYKYTCVKCGKDFGVVEMDGT